MLGPHPEVVGRCTRKNFWGKICDGDVEENLRAMSTADGVFLYGPGAVIGYKCRRCGKKYDRPPLNLPIRNS